MARAKRVANGGDREPSGAVREITGARAGTLPRRPVVQLASLVAVPPAGDDWLHEMKFVGYRVLARLEAGRAELWTRNGKDWTDRFPAIAAAVEQLGVGSALLDGEVVVQRPDGTTSFQALQNAGPRSNLLYYVFDLLHVDGLDLTRVQQLARKEALRSLLSAGATAEGPLRFSDHVVGHGEAFFRQACSARLEGIISKRIGSVYRGGRSGDWQKVKCLQRQEFVVVGFTEPAGSRQDLGALLVATHEGDVFVYRGRVGTGFGAEELGRLRRLLSPL